jgi:tRNA pseudouridine38-40 synthase
MTARLRMTVAYDGTDFSGWQGQPGKRSVQGDIEAAFRKLGAPEDIRVHGSGRTDSGVHARGQVFHVDPFRDYPARKWMESLNGVLPDDVRIMEAREVAADFHARFDAIAKEYRYFIFCGVNMPPDLRRTFLRVRSPLDIPAMHACAALLQGEHDFKGLSANRGYPERTTVRHLSTLVIEDIPEGLMVRAAANGFLYKMVRKLVGCLLYVGRGEMSLENVQDLLDHPRRTPHPPVVGAEGLYLWRVWYPGDPA